MRRTQEVKVMTAREMSAGRSDVGLGWFVWFCICLVPVVTGDGLSLNYLFCLTPLFFLLMRGHVMRPPEIITATIVLFTLIYLVAAIYQVEWLDMGLRRLGSFLIFMTMFSFCFFSITPRMRGSFFCALIFVSVCFSAEALVKYIVLGPETLAFAAKTEIGTQRLGFMYLVALWVAAFWIPARDATYKRILRVSVVGILVVGLFLTFSRSSIVALLASLLAFFTYAVFAAGFGIRKLFVLIVLPAAVFGAVVATVLYYFPIVGEFYDENLFSFFASGEVYANLEWGESSEGLRLVIWHAILDFVAVNPLTGSGFLGVWAIFHEGSAHNQHMDTLLRLGVIGAAAYFFLLLRLLQFLYRHHKGLFFGMVGVLVYGLFHETFKESQGALMLAFVLGMYATSLRRRTRDGSIPVLNRPPRPSIVPAQS
jgi:O-antigen ligase